MDDFTTDIDSTTEEFDWSDFGKAVAVESATAFAISAASVVGFLGASYVVAKIAEFRVARKIKAKADKADTDKNN